MEALSRIIAKINSSLTDLSASQRLSIGLCAVVIVGSFLWLVRWSAEPEYVRLLDQPMTMAELQTAAEALPEGSYRIRGEYILVSPQRKHALIWDLQSKGAMPEDSSISFKSIIDSESPFRPEAENKFRRLVALQGELSRVIASSKLIKSAEVFITDTTKRRISGPSIKASASVKVTMATGHSLSQEMVNACAALVAGSVPGLVPHNVSVIDGSTMMAYNVPDPEDSFARGMLREQEKHEQLLLSKINNQLSYIPGVRVAVSVELDPSVKESHEFEYTEPAIREEQTRTSSSQSGSPSGESGVGPNVGRALTGNTGGQSETTEESTSSFQDQKLRKEQKTKSAPYMLQRASASVAIPRSYLVNIFKSGLAPDDETAPTKDDIETTFQEESDRVRSIVGNILMTDVSSDVSVTYVHDVSPGMTVLPDGTVIATTQVTGTEGWVSTAKGHIPEIVLGVLALFGVIVLARIAKRSAHVAYEAQRLAFNPEIVDEESEEPLTIASGLIGRVDPAADSVLEGHEVDEDSIRASQVSEQVRSLVEENPAGVAKLLRRWTDVSD